MRFDVALQAGSDGDDGVSAQLEAWKQTAAKPGVQSPFFEYHSIRCLTSAIRVPAVVLAALQMRASSERRQDGVSIVQSLLSACFMQPAPAAGCYSQHL